MPRKLIIKAVRHPEPDVDKLVHALVLRIQEHATRLDKPSKQEVRRDKSR